MKFRGGYTVEVWRGARNSDGDRATSLALVVERVGVQWETATEVDAESSERVITVATLVFDHTPEIALADQIVIRGLPGKWVVISRVQPAVSPFSGWSPGSTVKVREV